MNLDYITNLFSTPDVLNKIEAKFKYKVFKDGLYNLNIFVIRDWDRIAGTFNDIEVVCYYNYLNNWTVDIYNITTDPSELSLINTKNKLGCAIIMPQQMLGAYKLDYHKGKKDHPALIQVLPVLVARDNNKDKMLDMEIPEHDNTFVSIDENKIVTTRYTNKGNLVFTTQLGLFGLNNHRASQWSILNKIGLYSEGCMVHQNPLKYKERFIYVLNKALEYYPNKFTITLFTEKQIISI